MEHACDRLIQKVIETANGQPTCNEKRNDKGIAIFKTGVTL
jgi:altronate dehydratase